MDGLVPAFLAAGSKDFHETAGMVARASHHRQVRRNKLVLLYCNTRFTRSRKILIFEIRFLGVKKSLKFEKNRCLLLQKSMNF